jgi:cobalt-zinc-cadmium efflux system membrane fusion protein
LTGQVQAASPLLAHVYSLVAGQALQIPVSLGQNVQKGQVLAVVRSDTIGQLEGDLLNAMLQLDEDIQKAEVQLNFSKQAYERENKLFQARVSAKSEVEQAYSEYQKNLVDLSGLRAKRQATIRTYQERLALYGLGSGTASQVVATRHIEPYIRICASRTGLLIARDINVGELVDPSKELFQIADLSRVWIIGNVFEKDMSQVKQGQAVNIQLDSLPDQQFVGSVSMVGSVLDPQTRTLPVRVDVPNPSLVLKPNGFARIDILTGEHTILAIPKSAIQQSGDHTYVYVPTGPHQYEERQVSVTMTDQPFVEVASGLQQGEQVVVNGTLALKGEALKATLQ